MTRNEFIKLVKSMLIGMCCGLPFIIVFDVVVAEKISSIAITFINVAVLILAGVIGYFVGVYRRERIKKKRAAYLAKEKEQSKKEQLNGTTKENKE